MTCDLSMIPQDKWNKRRTLSAVIIAVLPIKQKASTIRRNVVLRDEHGECVACVWGNHTQIINESTIGRPVTFQRVCLQDYEGIVQLAMPKDASITLGSTPKTAPVNAWFFKSGNTVMSVPEAQLLEKSSIIAMHGIIAKVSTESITLKDGIVCPLTTVILADGPPHAAVSIQFWNAKPDQVSKWDDMLHQAANVTMIRCNHASAQRGNGYDAIGSLTKIIRASDPILEAYWLKPKKKEE